MLYEAILTKQETYWWDEDRYGTCAFAAADDDEARAFIATVVRRINRKYWRIGEPRNVSVVEMACLTENGFEISRRWVCIEGPLGQLVPFQGFREVRKVLEAFYPKDAYRGRSSVVRLFVDFEPIRNPRLAAA